MEASSCLTAAIVSFVRSGISVDIVPVIEDDTKPGSRRVENQTCAPCQIQFIRDRKSQDNDFRTLVRLAKKCRTRRIRLLRSLLRWLRRLRWYWNVVSIVLKV